MRGNGKSDRYNLPHQTGRLVFWPTGLAWHCPRNEHEPTEAQYMRKALGYQENNAGRLAPGCTPGIRNQGTVVNGTLPSGLRSVRSA